MTKMPRLALILGLLNILQGYVMDQAAQNFYVFDPSPQNTKPDKQQSSFGGQQRNYFRPPIGVINKPRNLGKTSTGVSNANGRFGPQMDYDTSPKFKQDLPQLDGQQGTVQQNPTSINKKIPRKMTWKGNSEREIKQQIPELVSRKQSSGQGTRQKKYNQAFEAQISEEIIKRQNSDQITKSQNYDKATGQRIPKQEFRPQDTGQVSRQQNYYQDAGQQNYDQATEQRNYYQTGRHQNYDQAAEQQNYYEAARQQTPEQIIEKQNVDHLSKQKNYNQVSEQTIPVHVIEQQNSSQISKQQNFSQISKQQNHSQTEQRKSCRVAKRQKPDKGNGQKRTNQTTEQQILMQVNVQKESINAVDQQLSQQVTEPWQEIKQRPSQEIRQPLSGQITTLKNSGEVTGQQSSYQEMEQQNQEQITKQQKVGPKTIQHGGNSSAGIEQYLVRLDFAESPKLEENIAARLKQLLSSIKNTELRHPTSQSQHPEGVPSPNRESSRNSLDDRTQQNHNQMIGQQISDKGIKQNLEQINGQQPVSQGSRQQIINSYTEQNLNQPDLEKYSELKDKIALLKQNNFNLKNDELNFSSSQPLNQEVPSETTVNKPSKLKGSTDPKNKGSQFGTIPQSQRLQYPSQSTFLNQNSNLYDMNRESSRRKSLVDPTQQNYDQSIGQQQVWQVSGLQTGNPYTKEGLTRPERGEYSRLKNQIALLKQNNSNDQKNGFNVPSSKPLNLEGTPSQTLDLGGTPSQTLDQEGAPSEATINRQSKLKSSTDSKNKDSQFDTLLQDQRLQYPSQWNTQPNFNSNSNQNSNVYNLNHRSSRRNSLVDQIQQHSDRGGLQQTSNKQGENQPLQEKALTLSESDEMSRRLFKNQGAQSDDHSKFVY